MLGAIRDPIDLTRLSNYSVPTVFITAAQDQIFSPAMIRMVSDLVPGSRLVHLGDAGHSSYFEAPLRFNKAVDDFLDGLEVAAGQ